ncbi:MAG: hypothetical protein AAGF47_01740 [Planctomycetota bacterium]
MSQATGRPDMFGRTHEIGKPTMRQRVSGGVVALLTSAVVWAFSLGTAAKCFVFARQVWDGGMAEFLNASLGSLKFSASGLHYQGQIGAAMAGGQGLAVVLGLALTLSPSTGMRRLGSLLLVAWAGLWLAGGLSLAMEVTETRTVSIAAGTAVIFLCAMHRTARIWAPRRGKQAGKKSGSKGSGKP